MTDVDAALVAADEAKAAYRADPTDDNRALHRAAAEELRYARWVDRGGPDQEPTKSTEALHERWRAENEV